MIDWNLVRHSIWICGGAVLLAAWSFGRSYSSAHIGRVPTLIGAALFSTGFALVTPLWLAVIWSGVALLVVVTLWRTISSPRRS